MTRPRILLVEDEPAIVRGLSDTLAGHGFEVAVATDGQAGLDAALKGEADLILLDVMLPAVNGYEICQTVRRHGFDVPILMLTARGQEPDVVLGLNVGADDYIVKPFRSAELVARVQAFLRRRRQAPAKCTFADCEIDLVGRRVRRRGVDVELTAKEYALLAFFAGHPGRALSRALILDAVWGTSVFVTPRSIDRCVTTLRAKVEPDPRAPAYIQTVRDVGYRFDPSGAAIADG